jgi:selenide,water dikinase
VQDSEIKFGYAVTGEVHPRHVLANAGAQPGDALILTKPLGTGVIATALKFGRAPAEAIEAAIRTMTALNKAAADVLRTLDPGVVHGCTDITGFGLIGHATEMAVASGCSIEIEAASVPLIEGAVSLVHGNIPAGGRTNREHFGSDVRVAAGVRPEVVDLLYDPQTSGGLLAAVVSTQATAVVAALASASVTAAAIGRVTPPSSTRLSIY